MNDTELIALVDGYLKFKDELDVIKFKTEQYRLKLVEYLETCANTKDVGAWRLKLAIVPTENFRLKDAKEVINVDVLRPFITSSVQKRVYIKKIA